MFKFSNAIIAIIFISSLVLNISLLRISEQYKQEFKNIKSRYIIYPFSEDVSKKIKDKVDYIEEEFTKNNIIISNKKNQKEINVKILCDLHNNISCVYAEDNKLYNLGNADNEKNINIDYSSIIY